MPAAIPHPPTAVPPLAAAWMPCAFSLPTLLPRLLHAHCAHTDQFYARHHMRCLYRAAEPHCGWLRIWTRARAGSAGVPLTRACLPPRYVLPRRGRYRHALGSRRARAAARLRLGCRRPACFVARACRLDDARHNATYAAAPLLRQRTPPAPHTRTRTRCG